MQGAGWRKFNIYLKMREPRKEKWLINTDGDEVRKECRGGKGL